MALSSMTGFAQHAGETDGLAWTWELRSVNGKSLDVRFRMPTGCEILEVPARAMIGRHLKRGNVQATLSLSSLAAAGGVVVNEGVLEQLVAVAEKLRARLGGPELSVEGLLAIRGVVEPVQQGQAIIDVDSQGEAVLASFEKAAEALDVARRSEGARLHDVISAQLDRIAELTVQARDCQARAPEEIKARLREQIAKLLEPGTALDADRLHQEAVILATRADIQEEIDRLFSHIESARHLMASGEPAGRKFEFLSQEFNREANTVCSKSSDRSLTAIGLELKTIIDQLREQVQNIE